MAWSHRSSAWCFGRRPQFICVLVHLSSFGFDVRPRSDDVVDVIPKMLWYPRATKISKPPRRCPFAHSTAAARHGDPFEPFPAFTSGAAGQPSLRAHAETFIRLDDVRDYPVFHLGKPFSRLRLRSVMGRGRSFCVSDEADRAFLFLAQVQNKRVRRLSALRARSG